MLYQALQGDRGFDLFAITANIHPRQRQAAFSGNRHVVLRRLRRPVMIQERPNMQDVFRIGDATRLQVPDQTFRIADIAGHQQMRQAGQGSRSCLQRPLVKVRADQLQRITVQYLAASGLALDSFVNVAQQRTVAAPHISDIARLCRDRLAIEYLCDQLAERLKINLVLRAAAGHVELALDMQFMPLFIAAEDIVDLAEQDRIQAAHHRPIGDHRTERPTTFDEIATSSIEREPGALDTAPPTLLEIVMQYGQARGRHRVGPGRALQHWDATQTMDLDQQRRQQSAIKHSGKLSSGPIPSCNGDIQPVLQFRASRFAQDVRDLQIDQLVRICRHLRNRMGCWRQRIFIRRYLFEPSQFHQQPQSDPQMTTVCPRFGDQLFCTQSRTIG
ncbi:hypothetical protein BOTU111921_13635 [Bordetella tumbae]